MYNVHRKFSRLSVSIVLAKNFTENSWKNKNRLIIGRFVRVWSIILETPLATLPIHCWKTLPWSTLRDLCTLRNQKVMRRHDLTNKKTTTMTKTFREDADKHIDDDNSVTPSLPYQRNLVLSPFSRHFLKEKKSQKDTFWKRKKIPKIQEDFALFALWTCSLIPNTVQRCSRQEWISHCLPQQGGQDYGEETLLRRVIVALECASASLLRWKVSLFAQLMPGTLLLHPTNDIASTSCFSPVARWYSRNTSFVLSSVDFLFQWEFCCVLVY